MFSGLWSIWDHHFFKTLKLPATLQLQNPAVNPVEVHLENHLENPQTWKNESVPSKKYPPVNVYIAIENCPFIVYFPQKKMWFSIVMLAYQRVFTKRCPPKMVSHSLLCWRNNIRFTEKLFGFADAGTIKKKLWIDQWKITNGKFIENNQ